jgi:hypothetical protein
VSEPSVESPVRGSERTVRSIKRSLPRRENPRESGTRESRARSVRAKAMEAVKILEGSREGLPGVRGAERPDSGGGNWRGPPRTGDLRKVSPENGVL